MIRSLVRSCVLSWGLVAGLPMMAAAQESVTDPTNMWLPDLTTESLEITAMPEIPDEPPTIIVRPSTAHADQAAECRVELEPLGSPEKNQYRLKLTLPKNVSEIEILPPASRDTDQRVRVVIEHLSAPAETAVPKLATALPAAAPSERLGSAFGSSRQFRPNPFYSESPLRDNEVQTPIQSTIAQVSNSESSGGSLMPDSTSPSPDGATYRFTDEVEAGTIR